MCNAETLANKRVYVWTTVFTAEVTVKKKTRKDLFETIN